VRARLWTAVVALLCCTAAAPDDAIEANLEVVGRWEVGVAEVYADVAVAGTTAVVATSIPGTPCGGSARVVHVKDARRPRLVASIEPPPGTRVAELDAASLETPSFAGDVAALVFEACTGAGRGSVALYDITDPAAPKALSTLAAASAVSLGQRIDGRALVVRATAAGVAIDDVSDPASPAALGSWSPPAPAASPCGPVGVQLYDDGELAVAVLAGGVHTLDLIEPSRPTGAGPAEGSGGAVGVLPLGNRTVAVVAEDGRCPPGEPGLRVLEVKPGEAPVDVAPLRYAGAGAPARMLASGGYAYVAWGAAGLRVVDFAEVRPKTVAQFAPAQAEVAAVALLPEHVVVADANQGLFVLERPDEGGGRATFWSQFLSLLPYLGFAGLMAAGLLVPRMLASRAGATVRMPVPGAEPVRRRRRA
jgi:hypothetical protein